MEENSRTKAEIKKGSEKENREKHDTLFSKAQKTW